MIDGDLGVSGSVTGQRAGFEWHGRRGRPRPGRDHPGAGGLPAGPQQCGLVPAARPGRGVDTLVADADGVYHPALFNDRLVLGLKGTMAEAELHVLRARLDGGIRNKAARGELRRGLPVGLVWGEADGEIRFHPDEAVTGVIAAVFERFAVCGSVRGDLAVAARRGPALPAAAGRLPARPDPEITWVEPTYHAVHTTLTHPAYAGAYAYGRTRQERYLDAGRRAAPARAASCRRDQWEVLIPDHHPGFIDWDTYQANQARIGANIRPQAHQPGTGAVREGCALLQGLATCGTCGRKLAVFYDGAAKTTPGYYCSGTAELVNGRGTRHLRVGGAGDRRRRRRRVPGRAGARRAAGLPGSRRAARRRPRRRAGPAPPPGRAGPLPRHPGRTPLPGRRSRTTGWSPAASKREWETALADTGRRRSRARPPRRPPARKP